MQYAPTNDRVRLLGEFIHMRPDTLTNYKNCYFLVILKID